MTEETLAYCVKEKTKKPMNDAKEVTLTNGRKALQGVCSSCGTKMTKFISSKSKSNPGGENAGASTRERVVAREPETSEEPMDTPKR